MDVFRSSMQRKLIKESDLFDWEKENSEEDASVNALQTTLALVGITTRADLVQNNTTQHLNSTKMQQTNVPHTGAATTMNPNMTQQPQTTAVGAALVSGATLATPYQQQQQQTLLKDIELNNVMLDYSNRNDSNFGNESMKLKQQQSLSAQQQPQQNGTNKNGEKQAMQQNNTTVQKRSSTVDQQRLADNSQNQSLQSLQQQQQQQQRKSRAPMENSNMT